MFAGILGNGVTRVARPDWRPLKHLCRPGLETQELSRVPAGGTGGGFVRLARQRSISTLSKQSEHKRDPTLADSVVLMIYSPCKACSRLFDPIASATARRGRRSYESARTRDSNHSELPKWSRSVTTSRAWPNTRSSASSEQPSRLLSAVPLPPHRARARFREAIALDERPRGPRSAA